MKTYFGIAVLLSTFLLAPTTWADETSPDTLVDNTAQEVLSIIKQNTQNKAALLDLVETKILPHFNFTRMTQLAMGKNWSKATPQQQRDLENKFRTLLVRTYYKALAVYSDHTIKVTPLKNIAGETDVTVKTEVIQSHGQPVPINYSMQKTSNGWKVYDVVVAGVSLVINYRGSFGSKIRSGGVEGLIEALDKKNRTLDAKDKEEEEKSAVLARQFKTA
ncbi:MAG: ABC transporter substrate-binding protein [Nitrosomonadales bacterium]|nr:MAG: ABC transporter substrate-binding protein [Nitrosomonadales bacterium]